MIIPPKTVAGLQAGLIGIGLAAALVGCGGGNDGSMNSGMATASVPTQALPDRMPVPAPPGSNVSPAVPAMPNSAMPAPGM